MRAGRVAAFVLALVAVLCAGLWLGGHPSKLPEPLRDTFVGANSGLNVEATEAIEENYYRDVAPEQLTNSSLQGMVRGLRKRYDDRFSEYFSPEVLAHFNEQLSGRFSGIGLAITEVDQGLRVSRVFKGTPADLAGITTGDVIVSVNGESLKGVDSTKAAELIKGAEGTEVTVGVEDAKSGDVRELKIVRAEIAVPVAVGKVEKKDGRKFGYVRLTTFSEGAHAYFRKAV